MAKKLIFTSENNKQLQETNKTMKLAKVLILSLSIILCASCGNPSKTSKVPTTPQEALTTLLNGNGRFVDGNMLNPNADMERVVATAPHQEPFAAIVGCSDSRVPVELIFDQGIGDIFVIRTAGNNVGGDMVMGSVEYAVDHLGVKVLLVLGHSSCGGVTSAISHGEHSGAVGNLLHHIQADIPNFVGKPDMLDEAIVTHTHSQVATLLQNDIVAASIKAGKLIVKAAHYDIHTGKVTILD